ncbi:hypothetical protein EEB14_54230 [Rhodococcus sp. WS4]|nr:hypothetical protein EEB14_54230 [Rhodococcus sp. WS4]
MPVRVRLATRRGAVTRLAHASIGGMSKKRFNFAYVGDPPPGWTAHLKWSARILRLAGESIPDKELELELEREEQEHREKRAQRPPGRREVPEFRKRPDAFLTTRDVDPVLYEPKLSIPFRTNNGLDLRFTRVKVYENGVGFDLVAREPDPDPTAGIPFDTETINLGYRIRPDKAHKTRIRLVLAVSPTLGEHGFFGGTVLSNSYRQDDFPDDPNEPWLSGGGDSRGRVRDLGAIETRAHYFLSPVPTKSTIHVTVAYPEFGLRTTSIEFYAANLRPPGR